MSYKYNYGGDVHAADRTHRALLVEVYVRWGGDAFAQSSIATVYYTARTHIHGLIASYLPIIDENVEPRPVLTGQFGQRAITAAGRKSRRHKSKVERESSEGSHNRKRKRRLGISSIGYPGIMYSRGAALRICYSENDALYLRRAQHVISALYRIEKFGCARNARKKSQLCKILNNLCRCTRHLAVKTHTYSTSLYRKHVFAPRERERDLGTRRHASSRGPKTHRGLPARVLHSVSGKHILRATTSSTTQAGSQALRKLKRRFVVARAGLTADKSQFILGK
ncbi:unnamed protein product [Trichogramma brassicae]|uniref:Uncharacterized protein n=1 Tax=Trichogramma brassicae TaxID=86971 RepID=A0A6H5J1A6_9HYME|nr:unnamed protein product [Trichogramma brassicae]